MAIEFDTTVRSGMPVTVCYEIGICEPYSWIEDLWLEVRGERAEWLERRLNDQQWGGLNEEAMENYFQS
tara:strand:+ start:298 stop:504 length:207 start_codon:yes stop_codon:yes gene_type:complete